jgi:integrase
VLEIKASKGKTKPRVVYLPDEAFEIVVRLAEENPQGKLFRNSRGQPWNRNSLRLRFRPIKVKLKLPALTPTALRHSFAHHRLVSGQDSQVVSKLMGHVDGRMLATRYAHLEQNPAFMQRQANYLANLANPSGPLVLTVQSLPTAESAHPTPTA